MWVVLKPFTVAVVGFVVITLATIILERFFESKKLLLLGFFIALVILIILTWEEIVTNLRPLLIASKSDSKVGIIVSTAVGLVVGCCFYFGWQAFAATIEIPSTSATSHKSATPDLKLVDYFLREDFPYTIRQHSSCDIGDTKGPTRGRKYAVETQLYLDFQGKSKFIGFYFAASQADFVGDMIEVAKNHKAIIKGIEASVHTAGGWQGDEPTEGKDLVFTGQVLLYYETILSPIHKAAVIKVYKRLRLNPQFRGLDYELTQNLARRARAKEP